MSPVPQLGFIVENIGGGEIVVIIFCALVILGPDRIPEMARTAGRVINNLRRLGSEMTGDMNEVMNDPAMQPIRELGEFATRPRQKLAEYALEAEAEERARAAAGANGDSGADDESADASAGGNEAEQAPAERNSTERSGGQSGGQPESDSPDDSGTPEAGTDEDAPARAEDQLPDKTS